ncbi:hypothetical protein [Tateyamaria pelophila]|uniref:hypothetical protein n=1 Tax=Tateyamaria pelophila TaxID=328415 RepID=UPI001CBBDE7B|nr:hypothetical protein [Tateyamaria pelophila]
MRLLAPALGLWVCATTAVAEPDIDRLIDAMGMPELIRAFSVEGEATGKTLDADFLGGQGGSVWAETVRKLYDPTRLERALRIGVAETLDPDLARTALVFFDSDVGQRIVLLEVQAREAMLDNDVAVMAKAAGAQSGAQVRDFIALRNLVERNTDAGVSAQNAFFDGFAQSTRSPMPAPDAEDLRDGIAAETETWLLGYYALTLSALSDEDIDIYSDFWRTEVGAAVDDAIFEAFGDSYTTLSFALGQAVGLLMPADEL